MTVAQQLQKLIDIKEAIKASLISKGITNPGDNFASYSTIIDEMPQYGSITEQDSPKIFTGKPDPVYMESFDIPGALLSKNDTTWTVWNTNSSETGYWDPEATTTSTPSTQYGEVVAICVGKGLWAKIGWTGLTSTTYKWASGTSNVLYTTLISINIHGDGYTNTQNILNNYKSSATSTTVWGKLSTTETAYELYVASKNELLQIYDVCCYYASKSQDSDVTSTSHSWTNNISKLLGITNTSYMSSSQASGNTGAINQYVTFTFTNCTFTGTAKTTGYRTIALLKFK